MSSPNRHPPQKSKDSADRRKEDHDTTEAELSFDALDSIGSASTFGPTPAHSDTEDEDDGIIRRLSQVPPPPSQTAQLDIRGGGFNPKRQAQDDGEERLDIPVEPTSGVTSSRASWDAEYKRYYLRSLASLVPDFILYRAAGIASTTMDSAEEWAEFDAKGNNIENTTKDHNDKNLEYSSRGLERNDTTQADQRLLATKGSTAEQLSMIDREDSDFSGCFMFMDINGFTSLTEKFVTRHWHEGTESLTGVLNDYSSYLTSVVFHHGGDIISVQGDAIVVAWAGDSMVMNVETAVACALQLAQKCSNYHTEFGEINVKIGIAAGQATLRITLIDQARAHIIFGKAVRQAIFAQEHCGHGESECVLHGDTARFLELSHFKYEVLKAPGQPDYYKISGIRNPGVNKRVSYQCPAGKTCSEAVELVLEDGLLHFEDDAPRFLCMTEARRHVVDNIEASLGVGISEEYVRSFIPDPVLRRLDGRLPLAFMSELRRVETMFISLAVPPEEKPEKTIFLMDIVVEVVNRIVMASDGRFSKMYQQSDGLWMMIMFGLQGFRREDEILQALETGARIFHEISLMVDPDRVSIGISTGVCYCGVLGHPMRQEYTVIGAKVNLAARIMTNYHGVVACDEDTMSASRQVQEHFKLLPPKEMQGVTDPGRIFEYNPTYHDCQHGGNLPKFLFPMADRANLLRSASRSIDDMIAYAASAKKKPQWQPAIHFIEGQRGMGKTRVLEAIIKEASTKGCLAVGYAAHGAGGKNRSFSGARFIVENITGLITTTVYQARNDLVLALLGMMPPQVDIPVPALRRSITSANAHRPSVILSTAVGVPRQQHIVHAVSGNNASSIAMRLRASKLLSAAPMVGRRTSAPEMMVGPRFMEEYSKHKKLKEYNDSLWLLNDLLGLRFPVKLTPWAQDEAARKQRTALLLVELFTEMARKFADRGVVVGIDDATSLDEMSTKWLWALTEKNPPLPLVVIFTVSPWSSDDEVPEYLRIMLNGPQAVLHHLEPLPKEDLATVACQLLRARAVSKDVLDLLKKVSGGNVALWEFVLKQLMSSKCLKYVRHSWNLHERIEFGDRVLLQPVFGARAVRIQPDFPSSPIVARNQDDLVNSLMPLVPGIKRAKSASATPENIITNLSLDRVVVAVNSDALKEFRAPESIQGLTELCLDFLSPVQLHYLKCAAVVGFQFNLSLLYRMLPGMSRTKFVASKFHGEATRELVVFGYLECPREVHPSEPMVAPRDLENVKKLTSRLLGPAFHEEEVVENMGSKDEGIPIKTSPSKSRLSMASRSSRRSKTLSAKSRHRSLNNVEYSEKLLCLCLLEANPDALDRHIPCKALKFSSRETRKVILDAMVSLQKREIHYTAAEVLNQLPFHCFGCYGTSYTSGYGNPQKVQVDRSDLNDETKLSSFMARLGYCSILCRDLEPPTRSWLIADARTRITRLAPSEQSSRRPSHQVTRGKGNPLEPTQSTHSMASEAQGMEAMPQGNRRTSRGSFYEDLRLRQSRGFDDSDPGFGYARRSLRARSSHWLISSAARKSTNATPFRVDINENNGLPEDEDFGDNGENGVEDMEGSAIQIIQKSAESPPEDHDELFVTAENVRRHSDFIRQRAPTSFDSCWKARSLDSVRNGKVRARITHDASGPVVSFVAPVTSPNKTSTTDSTMGDVRSIRTVTGATKIDMKTFHILAEAEFQQALQAIADEETEEEDEAASVDSKTRSTPNDHEKAITAVDGKSSTDGTRTRSQSARNRETRQSRQQARQRAEEEDEASNGLSYRPGYVWDALKGLVGKITKLAGPGETNQGLTLGTRVPRSTLFDIFKGGAALDRSYALDLMHSMHQSTREMKLRCEKTRSSDFLCVCTCFSTLMEIFRDLRKHLRKADGRVKVNAVKAHLALLNIGVNSASHGHLGEAEEILRDLQAESSFIESLREDPSFSNYHLIIHARTLRLRAFIKRAYGDSESAVQLLKAALKELNYPFPDSDIRKHWVALTKLQMSIMGNKEKYQGAVLMSDPRRTWALLEASYCLMGLVVCWPFAHEDAVYDVGVASLMCIHAMEAAQCHFSLLAMAYATCLKVCCRLSVGKDFLVKIVEHSLALISQRKLFTVEDLVQADHFLTSLMLLVSSKGTMQEAATLALTYYPVNLELPPDENNVSILAVVPFAKTLDIQGLRHAMSIVRAQVESKPAYAPMRVDYVLMCLHVLLDTGVTIESVASLRKYSHIFLKRVEAFNDDCNHFGLLAFWALWYYRRKESDLGEFYYKASILRQPGNWRVRYIAYIAKIQLLECELHALVGHYEKKEWTRFQEKLALAQENYRELWKVHSAFNRTRLMMQQAFLEKVQGKHSEAQEVIRQVKELSARTRARRSFFKAKLVDMAWHGELDESAANAWVIRSSFLEDAEANGSPEAPGESSCDSYALYPYPIPKALMVPRNH